MNKKLLTLAVAAAMAAPAIASAEAILYGKLNVSLDYEKIDNVIAPVYNNSVVAPIYDSAGNLVFGGSPGVDYFYYPDGTRAALVVPTGTVLTPDQAQALQGTYRLAPGTTLPGTDFEGWGLAKGRNLQGEGRASRVGVKGSEDLGNGLKAIYQIELGINFDTNNNVANNADTISYRNTFVGLAGDWGTLIMGRHDTPMKISTGKLDLFSDTMADYNGTIGFDDVRADQAVAYVSPNWAGFQFMGAIIPGGAATAIGDRNWNNDGIASGYSLAAIYSNGPFYGSAAYESLSTDMFMNTATALNGCYPVTTFDAAGAPLYTALSCQQQTSDYNKWRFGLGLLDWNGFTLTAIYENEENLPGSGSVTGMDYYNTLFPGASDYSWRLSGGPDKRELWQVQAGYSFGNWMVKGMYGQASYSGGNTQIPSAGETLANSGYYQALYNDYFNGNSDSWAIGVDYNFSKRTKAYMLYTATTIDGSNNATLTNSVGDIPGVDPGIGGNTNNNYKWDGFSIGMMHSF